MKDSDKMYLLLNWGLPLLVLLLTGKAQTLDPTVIKDTIDAVKDPVDTLKKIDEKPQVKLGVLEWLASAIGGLFGRK